MARSPRGFGVGRSGGEGMPSRRCPSRHVHRRPVIRFLPPPATSLTIRFVFPFGALRVRSPNTPPLEIRFQYTKVSREWKAARCLRSPSPSPTPSKISRGEDPKGARMQGGSSGIVYGGLKYQASSSTGAFWNLLEQPPLTPFLLVVAAGAVHRGRARGRRLHHLSRRDPQPQGGERGASLARPWGRAASAGLRFGFPFVRGNGVRFDLDLELSACK